MHLRPKIFTVPRRYVQGPGVLRTIAGKQIAIFGKKALVVGGRRSTAAAESAGLFKTLEEAGITYIRELFGGECTKKEIARLAKIAKDNDCDVVISIGGGKVMDTGKIAAYDAGAEAVMIPTQVATNAAESAVSVVYTEEGVFEEYRFIDKNPALIVIDSEIIAKAPVRYLIAGIGDAASEKFEGEACYKTGAKNLVIAPEWVGYMTKLSLTLCQMAYENLRQYSEAAIEAVLRKVVTPALETIIETIVLWTGAGFECTGLAAAHSVHNGITAIEHLIPREKRPLHGELVNFGICTQLILEDRTRDEIVAHYKWSHGIGLPVTFEELGFPEGHPTDEELWKAAEKACAEGETIHNMPFDVTPEMVFYSMKAADELGKKIAKAVPRPPYVTW